MRFNPHYTAVYGFKVKLTSIGAITSTGTSFRSVGLYNHCLTASTAARTNKGCPLTTSKFSIVPFLPIMPTRCTVPEIRAWRASGGYCGITCLTNFAACTCPPTFSGPVGAGGGFVVTGRTGTGGRSINLSIKAPSLPVPWSTPRAGSTVTGMDAGSLDGMDVGACAGAVNTRCMAMALGLTAERRATRSSGGSGRGRGGEIVFVHWNCGKWSVNSSGINTATPTSANSADIDRRKPQPLLVGGAISMDCSNTK